MKNKEESSFLLLTERGKYFFTLVNCVISVSFLSLPALRLFYSSHILNPSINFRVITLINFLQVSDAFAGSFKEQRDMSANWLPVPEHKVPQPRPGSCTNDTKGLPDSYINFVKTHSLMDEPVPPFFGSPVLIRTGLVSRFTTIAVDPQVGTTEGKTFDVIFVGKKTISNIHFQRHQRLSLFCPFCLFWYV